MAPNEAVRHVKAYVEDRPLSETYPLALSVMQAFFFGESAGE